MTYGGIFDFFIALVKPLFPVFDAVFGFPFYILDPYPASLISLGLLSAVVAAIISLFYVILIDKEEYNRVREKQKELQEKMKEAQEEDDMETANKYMSESMSMQKKFMKLSIKPMIASMFIFFLFIPWVLTSFVPVVDMAPADDAANTTYEGEFTFLGGELSPELQASFGTVQARQVNGTGVLIYNGETYEAGDKVEAGGLEWQLRNVRFHEEDDERSATAKLAFRFVPLPFGLPLIGDSFEWLGAYILFQLPFTFLFRKMLGVQ